MSECIVRMEMPESCAMCDLHYRCAQSRNIGGIAMICEMARLEKINDKREEEYCLFICQLPERHGRLVDADALLRDIEQFHVSDGCFQHWLELQPTIVPAERSET